MWGFIYKSTLSITMYKSWDASAIIHSDDALTGETSQSIKLCSDSENFYFIPLYEIINENCKMCTPQMGN